MPTSTSLPTSMPAWQFATVRGGALEKMLRLNQVAPVPSMPSSPNATLVKVLGVSLNPVEHKIPEAPFMGYLTQGSPATPGIDFVGRVWATTDSRFKGGDMVFGKHEGPVKFGTLAGFTLVKDQESIAKVPSGYDIATRLDELGCVGVAGLTALQSFHDITERGPGQSVFINGGSGGVGTFGVQIAKHALQCADVVSSCSGANVDLVKNLGADEVIDYKTTNVVDGLKQWSRKNGGKKFDLIVDNVGNDPNLYWQAHHYLKDDGKYLQIGVSPSISTFISLTKIFLWPGLLGGGKRKFGLLMVKSNKADLDQMAAWMTEGKVKAVIDSKFSMDDVPRAYEKLKTSRAKGNIVIRVSEDGR